MNIDESNYTDNEELEIQEDIYLSFNVDEESYAINIRNVTEIIRLVKITPIPEVYDYMKGVINLRGKVIPVMDIRLRIGLEERSHDDRTCVVVVTLNGMDLGIIVDSVTEVINIPQANIDPSPDIGGGSDKNVNLKNKRFVSGIGKISNDIKIIIDLKMLLFETGQDKRIMGLLNNSTAA